MKQKNQLINLNLNQININHSELTADNFLEALNHYFPLVEKEYLIFKNKNDNDITWSFFEDNFQEERKLSFVYKLLSFIKSINSITELNEIFSLYENKLTNFYIDNNTNDLLYKKFINYKNGNEYSILSFEKQEYINSKIKIFIDNGVHLNEDDKEELKKLNEKLSNKKQEYTLNLQKTRDSLIYQTTLKNLKGLSDQHINKVKNFPVEIISGEKIYTIPYSSGMFEVIHTYCDNENIREEIFNLILTIGRNDNYNNSPIAQDITNTYHEIAKKLNYNCASDMLMKNNMVKDAEVVFNFLDDLTEKSNTYYEEETNDYIAFAKRTLNREPKDSDRAYVLNKMYEHKFNIDTLLLKKYFPEKNVMNGMFKVLNKIFSINFVLKENIIINESSIPIYNVYDEKEGTLLGEIIFDLFQRKGKRNGACCGSLLSRETYENKSNLNSLPIVFIICNVEPDFEKESLFTFDNIITLFHETGHALHHLFSNNELGYFNGTSKVQRDAVELPSQFLENFCYNPEVLKELSSHIETKENIPLSMINGLIESKNFLAATKIRRHILASHIDMKIYSEEVNIDKVEKEYIKKYIKHINNVDTMIETPKLFHIFTAGYNAGLYVYKWAEILAHDCFEALKESGNTLEEQKNVALKFKDSIYSKGGLKDMRENFIEFRGREPNNIAFLKSCNLYKEDLNITNKSKHSLK